MRSDHVLAVHGDPQVDERVDSPHESDRRRVVIRPTAINHTIPKGSVVILTAAKIENQVVLPVFLIQQLGYLNTSCSQHEQLHPICCYDTDSRDSVKDSP